MEDCCRVERSLVEPRGASQGAEGTPKIEARDSVGNRSEAPLSSSGDARFASSLIASVTYGVVGARVSVNRVSWDDSLWILEKWHVYMILQLPVWLALVGQWY